MATYLSVILSLVFAQVSMGQVPRNPSVPPTAVSTKTDSGTTRSFSEEKRWFAWEDKTNFGEIDARGDWVWKCNFRSKMKYGLACAAILSNGNLLVAEHPGIGYGRVKDPKLREIDRNGKVIWEARCVFYPNSLAKTKKGDVLVCSDDGLRLFRMNGEEKRIHGDQKVRLLKGREKPGGGYILAGTTRGKVIGFPTDGAPTVGGDKIVVFDFDDDGRLVRKITTDLKLGCGEMDFEFLPKDHLLITAGKSVIELDAERKVVRTLVSFESKCPRIVEILENGNIAIVSGMRIQEYSLAGKLLSTTQLHDKNKTLLEHN